MSKKFDVSKLKRNKGKKLESVRNKVKKEETKGESFNDDRFWYSDLNDEGTAQALIRFLPCVPDEEDDWVKYYRHSFKGDNGKWYIENSLTTFGLDTPDPVMELNKPVWDHANTLSETKKDAYISKTGVRKRNRRVTHVCNILVIDDKNHPENNGKVFLYAFGSKIMEKIKSCIEPEFDGDEPFLPFCPYEGANFKMKVKKVDGYPNYDACMFEEPSALFDGDDEKIQEVWEKCLPLFEFVDPEGKHFKTYDQLKERLNLVMGTTDEDDDTTVEDHSVDEIEDDEDEVDTEEVLDEIEDDEDEDEEEVVEEKPKKSSKPKEEKPSLDTDDDMDDIMSELEDLDLD